MKKFLLYIYTIFCSVLIFSQTNSTTRNRYALVIGNQEYDDYPIKTSVADATIIDNVLREKSFDVLFRKNETSVSMSETVNNFITKVNKDPNSVVIVYFAGHTFSDNDNNYLVPVDNSKFHTIDTAKSFSINFITDIAEKITTNSQIYIIDGSYETPFKETGSRALGIKGGLAAAKNAKESSVCYLFSTEIGKTVFQPNGKNSLFAESLVNEIKSSTKNISELFDDVSKKVYVTSAEQQKPYRSATTIKFNFNGNELLDLQKKKQNESIIDLQASSAQLAMDYNKELSETKETLETIRQKAADELLKRQEEINLRRKQLEAEDLARAMEESEKAKKRTESASKEIASKRAEFEQQAQEIAASLSKKSDAQERMNYITHLKFSLFTIRETANNQIMENNKTVEERLKSEIDEVNNRELKITEKDIHGRMTQDAHLRRQNEINAKRMQADADKQFFANQKRTDIASDNAEYLYKLKNEYKKLESNTYKDNSLNGNLIVRVGNFDGQTGKWKLHITSEFFGYATLFEEEVDLTYSDITGKQHIPIDRMTVSQFDNYTSTIELYDSLFRSTVPSFYVELSYKILKWKDASEYYFMPTKLQIISLDKKNRKITTIDKDDMNAKPFYFGENLEIRSTEERIDDINRATKIETSTKKYRLQKETEIQHQKALLAEKKEYQKQILAEQKEESKYLKELERNTKQKSKNINANYATRNSFMLSVYTEQTTENLMQKKFQKDISLDAEFSVSLLKYTFIGAEAEYNFLDKQFLAGAFLGFNGIIKNCFRPYILGGAAYDFKQNLNAFAGGGFDVIIGGDFSLNLKYKYNWIFDVENNFYKQNEKHKIGIGVGYSW